MCRWCRQYSNKLPVYLSHSHTFHEWCRSVRVGLYEELNVYICLNHSSRYKHNKLEKCHKKSRDQKAVFSKFRQFSYLIVFRERRKCLTCTFSQYTLSKLYSHCNQNCNFYYFLGTIICFVTKSCSMSF